MNLQVSSDVNAGVAKITLAGELDASSASLFREEIEKVVALQPSRLVLFLKELDFMASAGLRVLIFAKQRLGTDVETIIVQPQEAIIDTLEKTGFHHSVTIVENYTDRIE